ncbi:MAG: HEAT repeat domain-containing protein [Candidatus Obscuribacterales bacterium]
MEHVFDESHAQSELAAELLVGYREKSVSPILSKLREKSLPGRDRDRLYKIMRLDYPGSNSWFFLKSDLSFYASKEENELLNSPDLHDQSVAVNLLSREVDLRTEGMRLALVCDHADPRMRKNLLAMVRNHPDSKTRQKAALILAQPDMRILSMKSELMDCYHHESDEDVRIALLKAIGSLGVYGDKQVLDFLLAEARSRDPRIRLIAVTALSKDKNAAALEYATGDSIVEVSEAAQRYLARWERP